MASRRSGRKFRRGYDRVGGVYKLYGATRAGKTELKYLDKNLFSIKDASPDANQQTNIKWTTGAGNPINTANWQDGKWYVGQSLCDNQMGQGPSQRIGRKYTAKSLFLRFGFHATSNAPSADGSPWGVSMRIVLILDRQYNGGKTKITEIFEDPFSSGVIGLGHNPHIAALPNISNSQRFKTIIDKTYNYSFGSGMTGGANIATSFTKYQEFYKKLNKDIEMSGEPSDLAGIKSNNYLLLVCFNALRDVQQGGDPLVAQGPSTEIGSLDIAPWGHSRLRYADN